ncbi:hypothetical protein BJ165DRAFT_1431631 [Panaeolus papilionaceus]|nr:hypothetical protein BJ165DRAFT_1431631 [Panaeolus papilionaceus]
MMHSSFLKPTLSLLLALLFIPILQLSGTPFVAADHSGSGNHHNLARRHTDVARDGLHSSSTLTKTLNVTENSLERRGPGAQMTFFVTGLGACGRFNQPSDFIVALNKEQFDQGGACFKQITIRVGGRTAQAQIVDRCERCGWGNIDLTEGLFHFLGGTVQGGTLTGDWEYGGGGPAPTPKPKPTSTPPPPPPTTSPTSRARPTSTPRSSSAQATGTPISSFTPPTSNTASASVASPSDIVPADQAGNLAQLYLSYISMAGIALTAANQG